MNSEQDSEVGSQVAIVGIAGRFPGARDTNQFWSNLIAGRESIVEVDDDSLRAAGVPAEMLANPHYVRVCAPLDDMESFDAAFFGFSPREAAILDPQHRHFLECCWLALEDAGLPPSSFGGPVGVFAGSGHNAYLPYNLLTNPELVRSVGLFLLRHTGNDKDFLTTRASYLLNLKGPSVNVQTACSTSLVSVHLACQSLLVGECDMALAGGVTIELPHRLGYLYEDGEILSPDGHCRAFDASSQGTVFGSGIGVVALRRLADALADNDHIYAVIKGSAVNNDGALKVGYLAPSVDGQAKAIAEALAVANVGADTISYVEAHGTGTPVGDPIEVAALTQAFRRTSQRTAYCGLGSLKTNIGHLDTAAGVASLLKVVLALKHEQLPPTLHFTSPNPACDFPSSPFVVQAQAAPWPRGTAPRRAGVSSLGVGGTNAHVVVEEAPPRAASRASRPLQLIVQSARTVDALDRATRRLADHLTAHPDLDLADVSYTLRVGRQAMKHRRITVAGSVAELTATLEADASPLMFTQAAGDEARSVAFMFAGGGAQYPNMGVELHRTEPVYRDSVDACLKVLEGNGGAQVRAAMFPPPGAEAAAAQQLERPSIGLPALFITQYAQARLWMSWGVRPSAMIGHSMGEYTAACLADVLSLEDALALVTLRGHLFERVPEGAMLSVPLAAEALQPHLPPDVSIAAVNSPTNCVASGPAGSIDRLEKTLTARDIDWIRVRISVAAHSAMLEPVLGEFERFVTRVALHPPKVPIISNLTGTWLSDDEAADPRYWVRHLRQTVRFSDGFRELTSDRSRVLLEVGPGRTLARLAKMQKPGDDGLIVHSSLRHPDEAGSDVAFVLTVLGKLWLSGVAFDWKGFDSGQSPRRIPLPGYAFDRQRHWIAPGKTVSAPPTVAASTGKRTDVGEWTYQPVWHRSATPASGPKPGRVLVFADECGVGDRLAERLRGDGTAVVTVQAGRDYARTSPTSFVVDPGRAQHFETLVDALTADGATPDAIVHLWTLTATATALDADGHLQMQDRAFFSLLHLAQAVGRAEITTPVRLLVISNHMQRVGAEPPALATKAMLLGPVKVIPREYATIACRSVDVALATTAEEWRGLVDGLVAELQRPDAESIVAVRGAERWVQRFAPLALPAEASRPIDPSDVCLITGGYGGIGLEVAAHLASSARARLVLVGRHGVPAREAWPAWLDSHPPGDRTSRRIRRIEQMEAAGAEVLTLTGDVTRTDDMVAVVAAAVARFGGISTVVHAAGVLDDGLIELKDRASVARVLEPKIAGLRALDHALAGVRVDRVVLFSSTSAIAGLPGQVDYAAANAYLDAYAHEHVARAGRSVVSVNWSVWRDVGMAAALAGGDAGGPSGPEPTGHPLVEQRTLAGSDRSEFVTSFGTTTHWLLDEHRIKGGHALVPGAGFLEIARAAAAIHTDATSLELKDVAFLSPFVVHDDAARELRVVVSGSGATEFVIASPATTDGGGWHEHARGTVVASPPSPRGAADLEAIAQRCALRERVVSTPEVREHLVFGPRWNNVTRIRFGHSDALLTLRLPDAFVDDLKVCTLHPAMLDMAMAGAQELIPGFDERQDFYVPLSYTAVRIHAPLRQHVVSHVTYRERESSAGQFAVFDVTIYDEQGRALVELEEFTMVRVKDRGLLDGDGAPPVPSLGAPAKAARSSKLAVDLSSGIATDEGMTVLDRVMASGLTGQVVVSPIDFETVLAKAQEPPTPSVPDRPQQPPEPAGPDLGPVTAALLTHPAVADAVAIAQRDTTGDTKVVAYVVYDADHQATVSELRKHLRAAVTDDVVPHTFVDMDALPRSSDGRIDRLALVNPFGVVEQTALPETATEILIADLWRDLLGIGTVGVHDNFFDVGGHSLLSMRLIARLDKKTGVRLQHEHVVVNTLRQLAAKCDQMATAQAAPSVPGGGR